jgi:hypothetical protein
MRTRFVTPLLTLLIALLFGLAAAGGVVFDASTFDAFGDDSSDDEGYVDLFLVDGTLVFAFDEIEGSIPAKLEGDALPLDSDFDEDRLWADDALALYGGLAVSTDTGMVTIEAEGDGAAIHEALMARLADLGVQAVEDFQSGGPVFSYALSHGDDAWRLAVTPYNDTAVIFLRAN